MDFRIARVHSVFQGNCFQCLHQNPQKEICLGVSALSCELAIYIYITVHHNDTISGVYRLLLLLGGCRASHLRRLNSVVGVAETSGSVGGNTDTGTIQYAQKFDIKSSECMQDSLI